MNNYYWYRSSLYIYIYVYIYICTNEQISELSKIKRNIWKAEENDSLYSEVSEPHAHGEQYCNCA